MQIDDEDKLIANEGLFYTVRTFIRQKKSSAEISTKIEELLKNGADINACDKNDNNNTILHVAVEKEEKDVVIYLLEKGAKLFSVKDKNRAINIASQKNTTLSKEITEYIKQSISLSNIVCETAHTQESKSEEHHLNSESKEAAVPYVYPKRAGTSGVSGQFYETKLLSLVLHRALHDKDIKQFYLAANIKDIGDFDDLCFRYENVACFMQSKHRENTDKAKLTVACVRSSTGKLGLGTYFHSFLKIRRKFSPNATDPMFKGNFDEVDTYFVLYTPLKDSFDRKLKGKKEVCSKLNNIIYTGKKEVNESNKRTDLFQFDFEGRDLDFLTKFIKDEQMKILGKTFLEFVLSKNKLETMMASELVKIYHPALALEVITIFKDISTGKIQNKGKFRDTFFDSKNEHLIQLKETFYREIIYTHSTKTTLSKDVVMKKIHDIASNTCAENVSQLIGSPIMFDEQNDKLFLDTSKLPKNMFQGNEIQELMFCLQEIQVTKAMIKDAVNLAGQEKLQNLSFHLPQSFGNIEFTINKKKRLDFIADKFYELIEYYAENNKNKEIKIIHINADVVGPGKILEFSHLDSNGIGGAVGNLLEFDKQSELFTFNTKTQLAENAQYILDKIVIIIMETYFPGCIRSREELEAQGRSSGFSSSNSLGLRKTLHKVKELVKEDLSKYRFSIAMDDFPRTSFDIYQHDRNIASDFFGKLWFYTNQAQEESVEVTIKQEINIHCSSDKQPNQFHLNIHSDAIFLQFHDKVQKWWKRPADAQYLTKSTTIYKEAKKDIVESPILTVLSLMFIRQIKTFDVEFNLNAVDSLNLDEFINNDNCKVLNIVSDAVILSATKIMQYAKILNICRFMNLDYVHALPQNDYKTMIEELRGLKDSILVIVSETALNPSLLNTLRNILNNSINYTLKKQILITSEQLQSYLKPIFGNYDYVTLKDDNVSLIDLTLQSQMFVLDTCEIVYQGQKVKLNEVIDHNTMELINANLLWSLLNKYEIEIGHSMETQNYNEINNYYINRSLERNGKLYTVSTLHDIDDNIVLISSKPGMGKSILLTHLSLKTKEIDPNLWIVNIDMASYVKDLEKLTNGDAKIVMAFLSKAALRKPDEIENVAFVEINTETLAIHGKDFENISFELQLFVNCYNTGNIVFLFDGFDKVYPRYTNEALYLFTMLERANKRMWITSDYYAINVLELMFGSPYELRVLGLTKMQKTGFMDRFWTTNLKLEKLNHDQINNIRNMIETLPFHLNFEFFKKGVNNRNTLMFLSGSLHMLYLTLLEYFKDEANSLSWCYIREKINKKFNLRSHSPIDRYLRNCSENQTLELTGKPLHVYIARHCFGPDVTDKLYLDLNVLLNRSNVFMNAISLYKRYLKTNIQKILEYKNNTTVGPEQDQRYKELVDNHKKVTLYSIYSEKDISQILTAAEISEVKKTMNIIKSGEIKTKTFDTIVGNVPQFYHLILAEYFITEVLTEVSQKIKMGEHIDMNMDSFWNFLINVVLICGPPALKNAFEYKLKYTPEITETANSDNKKIIFELLLKQSKGRDVGTCNTDKTQNIANSEKLVSITNLLHASVQKYSKKHKFDKIITLIKSSATILEALGLSQSVLGEDVSKFINNLDSENIVESLNLSHVELDINDTSEGEMAKPVQELKQKIVELSENNENDQDQADSSNLSREKFNIDDAVLDKIAKPVQKLKEKIVKMSGNNENVVKLVEELPHHLPNLLRAIFKKND